MILCIRVYYYRVKEKEKEKETWKEIPTDWESEGTKKRSRVWEKMKTIKKRKKEKQ